MLIPLNLPNEDDKALSIVKINDDYSVALVSIANGYGMDPVPSYLKLFNSDLLNSVNAISDNELDLCVIFDKKLSSGSNLFLCLEEAIKLLKEDINK